MSYANHTVSCRKSTLTDIVLSKARIKPEETKEVLDTKTRWYYDLPLFPHISSWVKNRYLYVAQKTEGVAAALRVTDGALIECPQCGRRRWCAKLKRKGAAELRQSIVIINEGG